MSDKKTKDSSLENQIEAILDEIRPMIVQDGGYVVLSKVQDQDVYLEIQGACVGCPMANITFGMVVEQRLKEVLGDKISNVYYNQQIED
jgi:Fe-S cluster biogenesis protein NfuA